MSPFLFARKLYLPYISNSQSPALVLQRKRSLWEHEPHVHLLNMLWFPSQKAQQSRRQKRARPSLASIGSICIGSRTCLRTLVSTPPRSSSESPHLPIFSLNRQRTVQPDNGRVRGQLCERRRSQSRASNLDCIWGRAGVAIERTEVFEARHLGGDRPQDFVRKTATTSVLCGMELAERRFVELACEREARVELRSFVMTDVSTWSVR